MNFLKFFLNAGPQLHAVGTYARSDKRQIYKERRETCRLVRKLIPFVENTIKTRFYPLFDGEMMNKVLGEEYKNGVTVYVNNRKVTAPTLCVHNEIQPFPIQDKKRPVGIGFLCKSQEDLPEEHRGLAISTLGKVIKQGWDWIGIYPRNPSRLMGIVEVPAMAGILNTQKEDFQKCAKYYEFRKAIEKAVLERLSQMGEIPTSRDTPERIPKWLEKEIERVLGELLPEFPELQALLERRGRGEQVSGVIPHDQAPPVGTVVEGVEVMTGTTGGAGEGGGVPITKGESSGERIEPSTDEPTESGYERSGRKRLPALEIQFADDPSREELGWLLGSVLFINQGHPAYRKISGNTQAEQCHQLFTVAWVLSHHIESSKAPQEFINRFLLGWGKRT